MRKVVLSLEELHGGAAAEVGVAEVDGGNDGEVGVLRRGHTEAAVVGARIGARPRAHQVVRVGEDGAPPRLQCDALVQHQLRVLLEGCRRGPGELDTDAGAPELVGRGSGARAAVISRAAFLYVDYQAVRRRDGFEFERRWSHQAPATAPLGEPLPPPPLKPRRSSHRRRRLLLRDRETERDGTWS